VNARVYLNTTSLQFGERIDGGNFSAPAVRAYADLILRFRLAKDIEGVSVPDERTIDSVQARIGRQDAQPTAGDYTLTISVGTDEETTASIAYNATAAAVQTAINTAIASPSPLAPLHPCVVTEVNDEYRIIFADADETVDIAAETNALWPISFVNADRFAFNGGWATSLTLAQAPVAETSTVTPVVADDPVISLIQGGETVDGIAINEVQKITILPAYAGATGRIEWSGNKSDLLPGFPTQEQLQAALDGLAPDGGTFVLVPVEDGYLIEFAGSMSGEPQTLMTWEEFTPPPTEYLVKLSTSTAPMRTLMRGADTSGEIELPLDLVVTIDDADAPAGVQVCPFTIPITFSRPVSDDSRNVAAQLVWNQPLSRTDNLPFSTDAILVGTRAYRETIGDGAATSFVINHNLGSLSANFTADASTDVCTSAGHNLHNGDPLTVSSSGTLPTGLTAGPTYWVINATTDTFKLAATPGGAAINLTTAGTGTHSFSVSDGTTDAYQVDVWETGGSKLRVSPSAYTVARTTANSITISGFASTPTSGQYIAVVSTYGRPATYQKHNHPIAEITGLQTELDAIDARLDALEAMGPANVPFVRTTTTGVAISRALLPVWRVLRARTQPPRVDTLLGYAPYSLQEAPPRPSRLLPAVHDASTEALPAAPLPAPADSYKGRVFSTSADRADFPGGLKNGDFAACDGREWYRVKKAVNSESSYYPTAYDLELFRIAVNEDQLTTKSVAELLFGFEVAYFPDVRNERDRRTGITWTLFLEIGTATADTTPGTPGTNLDTFFASPITVIEREIEVTETPGQHRFGVKVARDGAGDLTVTPVAYRKELATVSAPSSANFVIRGRLGRFDTEDLPIDAKGLIAVRGLDVGLDGQVDTTLGRLSIS
jgi:hypothetical protein